MYDLLHVDPLKDRRKGERRVGWSHVFYDYRQGNDRRQQ